MNIWKLIRGFCKMTSTSYRVMKKDYGRMSPEKKTKVKVQLKKFWAQNPNELNHKRYYDLKIPLAVPPKVNLKSEEGTNSDG